MEVSKGVEVKFEDGKIVLSADLKALVLDGIEAKIVAGEIDLVSGTDLDKELLLKAIAALKALKI
jgi:hypothetical protein